MAPRTGNETPAARAIVVTGRVQGVGYRPFVYALAARHGLAGSVRNRSGEVTIHVEGPSTALDAFEMALISEAPPLARPRIASSRATRAIGRGGFEIATSSTSATAEIHMPPDQFVCADCLAELGDPRDRRYRHPFITCTQCGPRYTLIEALPYDRVRTSMAKFELCPACRREYEDPLDRRFHAEPLSCPRCGPTLRFVAPEAAPINGSEAALAAAVALLRRGGIIAVKGIGGYHLMCDAADDSAVRRLRQRKRRPAKPLAVLVPAVGSDDLASARAHVVVDGETARALRDPARPIVLAPRRPDCPLSEAIAPGLGVLGVFLPYSPLHHLLVSDFGAPLVATSGNVSGEPVITDPSEAENRLRHIADAFLHHDRAIVRHADDPVLHVVGGRARAIRLGRGTAPAELPLPARLAGPMLALGGQMKATIALGIADRAVISPHIGDLDSPRALDTLQRLAVDMPRLYGAAVGGIVVDSHPAYASRRWAARSGLPIVEVQHHAAHASALAGEHADVGHWLVFAWDGVGYGDDGTLWGGEALLGRPGRWLRVASFRPFRPVGGDKAAREPWRSAAALNWECGRDYHPPLAADAQKLARRAWELGISATATSAVGRLFDAAAALVIGIDDTSFEGEAAMRLENLAMNAPPDADRPIDLPLQHAPDGPLRTDWSPAIDLLTDQAQPATVRARRFHATMAQVVVTQMAAVSDRLASTGAAPFAAVGLTGGVFQNRLLAGQVLTRLARLGVDARMPVMVPANDGGLAYGQMVEAAARLCEDDTR